MCVCVFLLFNVHLFDFLCEMLTGVGSQGSAVSSSVTVFFQGRSLTTKNGRRQEKWGKNHGV